MKKVMGIIIATVMILGLVPITATVSTASAATQPNEKAIFVCNRWAPVGARWNGNTLVDEKARYFNGFGTAWGTTEYKMPGPGAFIDVGIINAASPLRINESPAAVEAYYTAMKMTIGNAQRSQLYSNPKYWTEFYLDVVPAKGDSQESNHWYAVVDDMGQLWFDPDGRFNDSRYYAGADPETEAYGQIGLVLAGHNSDNCKNNPHCKVDPSVANNTQGPYQYMPTDINGQFPYGWKTTPDAYPLFNYSVEKATGGMFFRVNSQDGQGRIFQVGYLDMPDFPLIRSGAITIPLAGIDRPPLEGIGTNICETTVKETTVITDTSVLPYGTRTIEDWDRYPNPLPLVRFLDGFDPAIPGAIPAVALGPLNLITQNAYFRIDNAIFEYGEEWHAANVVVDPPPGLPQFGSTQMDIYDPGEWIYRVGFNA